MTPAEYRSIIAALDLSQVGAARLLGVNERTSRNWAEGRSPITPPAARFLRLCVALQPSRSMEWIAEASAPTKSPAG